MNLTISRLRGILYFDDAITLTEDDLEEVARCYDFLKEFSSRKVIYGINTGFGPMAQWRVDASRLKDLQYNIIRSHATGMGTPLLPLYVRAAMAARLGTFLQARSGVHPDTLRLLAAFINHHICPVVPEHGSVGASGDLVQLAHVALALIGEGDVMKGENAGGEYVRMPAAEAISQAGIEPLHIHIREGLALTNGTSFMTGIGVVNQIRAERLLERAVLAAVWLNEVAGSFDDFMSAPLNECRRHRGQQTVAADMRVMAEGSHCFRQREHELYDSGHSGERTFAHKVQPYYSLRCIPQIYGPVLETLQKAHSVLDDELCAVSDNPVVDPVGRNVFHGGNFHGDYVSLAEDTVKIAMVRVAMTAERQLNYLLHDRINGILPPFLNKGVPGLNYGLQACQFTATSTTAECQTLAMPNYVHSIPNNNDNQDIVSMGTNTALLTARVLDNVGQVLAVLYMALAQATDCLSLSDKLAPATRRAYDAVRQCGGEVLDDRPYTEELHRIQRMLEQVAGD